MATGDSAHGARELVCKELVEAITDYLEGRLSDDERRRFDQHLLGCGGCRSYVEQMRETIRLVGTLTEDDVPPAGRERLLAAFRDWRRSRD
jgi:anti-sigma factor RsiW